MHISTYSFMVIPLKLYRCLGLDLKVCIYLDIILRLTMSFFLQVELSHFSGVIAFKVNSEYLVCATPTVL